MAVLTQAEITALIKTRLQITAATDAPFSAADIQGHVNEAYADLWEIEGGGVIAATSATLWNPAVSADTSGTAAGILATINEILHVWASTTSSSVGRTTGDIELDRRELSEIHWMRQNAISAYGKPKIYSIVRLATATPANVNLFRLDYWPGVSGYYFPAEYVPQFTPLDGASVTTPDLTDLGSRDLALLASARMAPLMARAELVPSIMADVSQRTREALERKASAAAYGKQDR